MDRVDQAQTAPYGPLLLIHIEHPPGSNLARCCGLPIPVDNRPGSYHRQVCPGCIVRDGRTYTDGQADGWRQLRAVLTGAALSWRTADGRRAFAELLDSLPDGPLT